MYCALLPFYGPRYEFTHLIHNSSIRCFPLRLYVSGNKYMLVLKRSHKVKLLSFSCDRYCKICANDLIISFQGRNKIKCQILPLLLANSLPSLLRRHGPYLLWLINLDLLRHPLLLRVHGDRHWPILQW